MWATRRKITGKCSMGKLYEYAVRIQKHIEDNNLDVFRSRGALALQCGFLVTLVHENDFDDPEKIANLKQASLDVLGLRLD